MSRLTGKVAVVTGASKGIGAGIAKALAAEGASVVVNYSSSKAGADAVVGAITKSGGKAVAVGGDVSKSVAYLATYAGQKAILPPDYFRKLAGMKPSFLVRSEQIAAAPKIEHQQVPVAEAESIAQRKWLSGKPAIGFLEGINHIRNANAPNVVDTPDICHHAFRSKYGTECNVHRAREEIQPLLGPRAGNGARRG